MSKRQLEQRAQIAAFAYLRGLQGIGLPIFPFAVPNEGKRSPVTAKNMRLAGLQAGVPDFLIALPDGEIVFVEVKMTKGRMTPAQVAAQGELRALGHEVHTFFVEDGAELVSLCESLLQGKGLLDEGGAPNASINRIMGARDD